MRVKYLIESELFTPFALEKLLRDPEYELWRSKGWHSEKSGVGYMIRKTTIQYTILRNREGFTHCTRIQRISRKSIIGMHANMRDVTQPAQCTEAH